MTWGSTTARGVLCGAALLWFGSRSLAQEVPPAPPAKLTTDQLKRLADLEETIEKQAIAGEFGEAARLAREVVVLRSKWQGDRHWQATDARLATAGWQRLSELPPEKQQKLGPAVRWDLQGQAQQSRQQLAAAQQALTQALAIYREVLGEKHPLTATAYNNTAMTLHTQGKHAEAQTLFRKALVIHREVLGEKHPDTAESYNDVAYNLNAQSKYTEAQPLYQKALELYRETLGEKHPSTVDSYNNVAYNLNEQGKYAEAQPLFRKALDICQEVRGEKHPSTAQCYNSVAYNLNAQGKYTEAQPLYQNALDIRLEVLGAKHPDTANSYNNVAYNLNEQGKLTEALPLFRKALDIRREVQGPKHVDTALSYNNVAYNLNAQGKYIEAQPLYQKALDIYREMLGEKHPVTARSYGNVAYNLNEQGKHAEALPLFRKALDIYREALGDKHLSTALGYNNVAYNLNAQGKYIEAQPLYQKALDIRREVLGAKHPDTASSYNNVAYNLDAQGKHAEALPLYRQALDIRREVLGAKHPDTALSYNNLAYNLDAQGKHAEALPLHRQALDIYREVLGNKHPFTARSYQNMAHNLGAQGRYVEALPLFRQALDICREMLGEKHPRTALCYQDMAFTTVALGDFAEAEKLLRAAALAHDVARLDRASSGFERALGGLYSPRPLLAALMARRGQEVQAWQHAEADLARGLLDDLADPADIPLPDPAAQQAVLHRLDAQLVPLLTAANLNAGQGELRDDLLRQRRQLLDDLSTRAAQRLARHLLSQERIQQHIAVDAALLFWLDAGPEHWACVLRRDGPPRWAKLPGTGDKGVWTDKDRQLHLHLYQVLAAPNKVATAERTRLMKVFLAQRFTPLRPHLQAAGKLPAVRRLLVVPTGAMARVPLEALLADYTVSYVPSGSVFARLAERHRPLQGAPLLALGDPLFALPPAPSPPPTAGLFLALVLPGSNAARNGLQAGDVLLRYNDVPLQQLTDLKVVTDGERVKVLYWRDGKKKVARLHAGKLGVSIDRRPAPEAVVAWQQTQTMLAALRSTDHPRLPATRFEAEALSRLVGAKQSTLLLGSDASAQALDRLGPDGLKRFRLLHFATHGDVDLGDPYRSALILAQDKLPDDVEAARKGAKVYNGTLTVATILREWQLDADLVVLSACQTGLGKSAEGDGLLGFAQAFLQKGARSVVLSRWKVDDTATALLMLRFYENALGKRTDLKAPLGRAQALEEARSWLRGLNRVEVERLAAGLTGGVLRGTVGQALPLLKTGGVSLPPGERPFEHPFYWASFVLVGDPD